MEQILKDLTEEVNELSVPSCAPVVKPPINSLDFYRNFVCSNVPCVLEGMMEDWGALNKWSKDYLSQKCGEKQITVDLTPNGRGDAVVFDSTLNKEVFVTPFCQKMTLSSFFHLHQSTKLKDQKIIPYVQHQNGNLLQEFPMLLDDVPSSLEFGDELFGQKPDAVNLWIGDERSVTSFHKDHYENFYGVIKGSKIFTLLPPSSVWRMQLSTFDTAHYHLQDLDKGEFEIIEDDPPGKVQWCPLDLSRKQDERYRKKYGQYFDDNLPQALKIEVKRGQMLYLPSLWFHYVEQVPDSQDDLVVAVNYWYDMKFDCKYAYFKGVENMAQEIGFIK